LKTTDNSGQDVVKTTDSWLKFWENNI
jgi:hypothetical protein